MTSKCNLNCIHCCNTIRASSHDIDFHLFSDLLDDYKKKGLFEICLSGGEPFLYKNIFELSEKCNDLFLSTIINTNGIPINAETVKHLSRLDNIKISVSLDGPEKIHNHIRGSGTYKKTINNIKKLLSASVPTYINFTASKYNIDFLFETVNLAINLGIRVFGVERMLLLGNAKNISSKQLNAQQFNDIIKFAHEINNSGKIFVDLHDPIASSGDNNKKIAGCAIGQTAIVLDTYFNYLPCTHIDHVLGNAKYDKLEDVWNNSIFLNQVRKRELSKTCSDCFKVDTCKGGCRAAAFGTFGDIFAEDPLCFQGNELNMTSFMSSFKVE